MHAICLENRTILFGNNISFHLTASIQPQQRGDREHQTSLLSNQCVDSLHVLRSNLNGVKSKRGTDNGAV